MGKDRRAGRTRCGRCGQWAEEDAELCESCEQEILEQMIMDEYLERYDDPLDQERADSMVGGE